MFMYSVKWCGVSDEVALSVDCELVSMGWWLLNSSKNINKNNNAKSLRKSYSQQLGR